MMRPPTVIVVVTFLVLIATARLALAQAGSAGPLVDVGVDASVAVQSGDGSRALAPRLTFNPARDTALTFRVDALVTSRGQAQIRSRRFVVELHRTFVRRGPWSVEGIAGAGVHRGEFKFPAVGPRDGSPAADDSSRAFTTLGPAWTLGMGLTQQVGTRALLRQDFRVAIHDDGPDMVVSAGVAVPLGRYAAPHRQQVAHFSGGTLRTGQRVWLTGEDGAVTAGIVGDVSAQAVEVMRGTQRTSLELARVDRIEVADSIADGARLGALIGAASMGALGVWISGSLCECDDGTAFLFVLATAGYGAGGGALAGALADSFHIGRKTLLDRTSHTRVAIGPILSARRAGASATVAW